MFDSHCHLHDARVRDPEAQIARARAAGVRGFLLAGVDPDGWRDEERLAAAHPEVAIALGVHPQIVAALDDARAEAMVAQLADRLASGPRPAAVGEIGLDGLGERKASLERQARAFRAQLALAREADLPVSLHILRAHGHALAILRGDGVPHAGGVVHSYSGDPALVRDYLALGLSLSFAGTVTKPNARRAREAVSLVPRERLLVETDAPDQTPDPHAPAPNEPAFLPAIVEAIAALRAEAPADVARYTDDNARRLFRLG